MGRQVISQQPCVISVGIYFNPLNLLILNTKKSHEISLGHFVFDFLFKRQFAASKIDKIAKLLIIKPKNIIEIIVATIGPKPLAIG